jgi:hypothetical protein
MNYTGSTAKETKPCRYCHCPHFTSKSATFSRGHGTTIAQTQKSTVNILCESEFVPALALPLPKAGGVHSVPQPKAGGDNNVPQHQKATFEVVKRFMEAIVFTKTPWPIISDEKYTMVDQAWQLAIEAQDRQWALAGAPVGAPSECQLLGGPSVKIDQQNRQAVSVYSVFCSLIGLLMLLIPKNIPS